MEEPIQAEETANQETTQEIISADIPARCTWKLVGASVQGVSHKKNDLPCQDAQAYRMVAVPGADEPVLLISLADGAGSAEHAELGAQTAVNAALQAMESALSEGQVSTEDLEGSLISAFASAREALYETAVEKELTIRSLATTLTCVILSGRVAVAQLGDGVVVARTSEEEYLAFTKPQRGEYANETYFLVQEDAMDHIQVQVWETAVTALAVMSDGLLRLALKIPSNEPHAPFFKPLFAFAAAAGNPGEAQAQLESFLNSDRVNARTDDDKSLVLAVCS